MAHIPRLEEVTQVIAYQQQQYNGQGFPGDGKRGEEIPLGSRILKVALDFDTLLSSEQCNEAALAELNDRPGWYDPRVLTALAEVLAVTNAQILRRVKVSQLVDGLTLAENIKTINGTLVCARGQDVTRAMRFRLRNFSANIGIQATVRVFVPFAMADRFTGQEPVTARQ
jgi:hypothetical protein